MRLIDPSQLGGVSPAPPKKHASLSDPLTPFSSSVSRFSFKKWIRMVGVVLGSMMLGAFLMAGVISNLTVSEFLLNISPKTYLNGINILILGIDDTEDVQRSDTIMVAHLDWEHNRIGILSIPRDTRMHVPSLGFTKINHAYAKGKEELAKKAVSQLLSIPIKYSITLRLKSVEKIVDQLGGIKLNISKNMYYADQSGDLFINFKAGKQVLNGKQAAEYLRFRKDNKADIGRIGRQQFFMKAVFEQVSHSLQLFEIPVLIRQLSQNFTTDLSIREMIGLAIQFKEAYKGGTIETGTLPGLPTIVNGVSYWKIDLKEAETMIQTILQGAHIDKSHTLTKIKTVDSDSSRDVRRRVTLKEVDRVLTEVEKPQEELKILQKRLRLEVLNGTGIPGVANQVERLLRKHAIDVVKIGNAGNYQYQESMLVDWRGKIEPVLLLARVLAIDPSKIIVYDRPQKPLDATLVLGQDWKAILSLLGSKVSFQPQGTASKGVHAIEH